MSFAPTNAFVNSWLRLNLNDCGRPRSRFGPELFEEIVERQSAAHRAGLPVSWLMLPKRDSRHSPA
jgi:hypothetical protein